MSTEEGMSGAWIVDSNTAELVGHLVAVSASSTWGYFIPIMETIEDMKAILNVNNVGLPQEGRAETHPTPGPIEHAHPIHDDIRDNATDRQPSASDNRNTAQPDNRERTEDLDEAIAAVTPTREPLGSRLWRRLARGLRYPSKFNIPWHRDGPGLVAGVTPGIDLREKPGRRLWRKLARGLRYPSGFGIPLHRNRPEPIMATTASIDPSAFNEGLELLEPVDLSGSTQLTKIDFLSLVFARRLKLVRTAVALSSKGKFIDLYEF